MATLPQLAPAALTPRLTSDEHLHTVYHPDVNFVDDHTEERHLGEKDHSRLQALLTSGFITPQRFQNLYFRT